VNFDAHALRARQDVLVGAGNRVIRLPRNFLIARHRSRLGRESIHREPSLAEVVVVSGA